jgi:hypothetical protein
VDGWVKIHRKMLDNPTVMKDPDYLAVWIYLILNATHKERNVMFRGKKIVLQQGQLLTGRKSISSQLSIHESKIRRILTAFEIDQQIDRQRSNKNSIISILNWSKYQIIDQQNDQEMTNKRPTSDQQVTTNNNDRKKECIIKDYAFNVSMMESEYEKLCTKHGEEMANDCIDYLSSYKAANRNYKRKSDYLSIIRWVVDTVGKSGHRSLGNMPLYVASDGLIKQLEKANAIDQQRSL